MKNIRTPGRMYAKITVDIGLPVVPKRTLIIVSKNPPISFRMLTNVPEFIAIFSFLLF